MSPKNVLGDVIARLKKALDAIEYIAANDPHGALALAESHADEYQRLLLVLLVDCEKTPRFEGWPSEH